MRRLALELEDADRAVTRGDIDAWYRTPGSNGRSIESEIVYNAKKYHYLDPEGWEGVRDRLHEALADAIEHFDASRIRPGEDKRRAFERFLTFIIRNEISDMRAEQQAKKRNAPTVSFDAPVGSEGDAALSDLIGDDGPDDFLPSDVGRLGNALPPDLRPGWDVLVEALQNDVPVTTIYPEITRVTGLSWPTFFRRLRNIPAFREFAAP